MDRVSELLYRMGENVTRPLFNNPDFFEKIDKGSGDFSSGMSPVTTIDILHQLLIAFKLETSVTGKRLLGEEYVPRLSKKHISVLEKFDVSRPIFPAHADGKALLGLTHDIIQSGKTLPKAAIEDFDPVEGVYLVTDPVDGTALCKNGEPDFSILLAEVKDGCVTSSWCYFPIRREMFRRLNSGASEFASFSPETGKESILPVAGPPPRNSFSEMSIVASYAHPNLALDNVTRPIFEDSSGRRWTQAEISGRLGNTFKSIFPTNCYSGSILLGLTRVDRSSLRQGPSLQDSMIGHVDAAFFAGGYPWDFLGPVHFMKGLPGIEARFLNGLPYLGEKDEVPVVAEADGDFLPVPWRAGEKLPGDRKVFLPYTGGLGVARGDVWDSLNDELTVMRHPLGRNVLKATVRNGPTLPIECRL